MRHKGFSRKSCQVGYEPGKGPNVWGHVLLALEGAIAVVGECSARGEKERSKL